jgi:single stranded DNA-binding protein
MFNINRITLIGYTGGDAKTTPNGPTTLSLATNVNWTDKQTNERCTRTEWHQLVVWNGLGKWAASLAKGTPLFVEGELVYEQYPRKVEAVIGKKTVEVDVMTRTAKVRVQKLIRLEAGTGEAAGGQTETGDAL